MSSAVKVATFYTQTEALIAAEYLKGNGIVATVMGDDAGGALAGLTLSKGFRIYVPDSDVAIATELLETPPADSEEDSMSDPEPTKSSDHSEINRAEY